MGDTGTFYHMTVPGGMDARVHSIEETLDGDEITLYLEDGTKFQVLEHNILDYDEHDIDALNNEDVCIIEWDPYENNSNSNLSTLPPLTTKRTRLYGGRRKLTHKRKLIRKRSTRKRKNKKHTKRHKK